MNLKGLSTHLIIENNDYCPVSIVKNLNYETYIECSFEMENFLVNLQ